MKASRTLIIKGGTFIESEAEGTTVTGDLVAVDGVIVSIGPGAAEDFEPRGAIEVLDARGKLVVPGFINAHYHSHDVLAKGMLEEVPLEWWALLALPPSLPPRSDEEIRVRTLLGALECLRGGITTVQDMVTFSPFNARQLEIVAEEYERIGIRAAIGPQYADKTGIGTRPFWEETIPPQYHANVKSFAEPDPDFDLLDYIEETYFRGVATNDGRISWVLAPTAPESCSDELIRRTAELSEKYDLPVFTHIYESKSMALEARLSYPQHGGSLITWMDALGLSGPRLNLAHSVWLSEDEIQAVAAQGTRVIINPLSNLKLKSGVAPLTRMQAVGVGYALGCDNPSCSDSQNMFQAMKLSATLNSISDPDPLPPQATPAYLAATRGGAEALGRAEDLGELAPGFRADLSLIDLTDPAWVPLNHVVRQLVYSEAGRGVSTVVVDGEVVIREGRSTKIDESRLIEAVEDLMPAFRRDLSHAAERYEAIRPYLLEAHQRVWQQDLGMHRLVSQ